MTLAGEILQTGLLVWFFGLVALIVFMMFRGRIRLRGLLLGSADDGGISPERLLAVVVAPFVLGAYALDALSSGAVYNEANVLSLPDVPETLLVLLGGSNGLYLAGKMIAGNRPQ